MRSKEREKEQLSERRKIIPAELQTRNCQDTVKNRVQKLIKCRSKCIREREQGLNVAGSGAISMAFSFPCGGTGIFWRILAKDFLSHSKDWGRTRLLT
jgi:hypothetical protein